MAAFRLSKRYLGKMADHVATGRPTHYPAACRYTNYRQPENSGLVPQNALLEDGDMYQSEHITLIKIPFVPQQDFDKLLNLADGAVIRGEDSFVRAQLAGKPFFGTSIRKKKISISTNCTRFGTKRIRFIRMLSPRHTVSFPTNSTTVKHSATTSACKHGKP